MEWKWVSVKQVCVGAVPFYDLAEIKSCIVSADKKKKRWLPDQVLILMNKSHHRLLAIFSVLSEEGTTIKPFQKGNIPWNASKICVLYVNYASVWKRKGEKEGRKSGGNLQSSVFRNSGTSKKSKMHSKAILIRASYIPCHLGAMGCLWLSTRLFQINLSYSAIYLF